MRWSVRFVVIFALCAVTLWDAHALGKPRGWSLPELVAFSDVVAVIDITTVGEAGPQAGEVGLCMGLGAGYDVRATFRWVDRITQAPYVRVEDIGEQSLTFFRSEFSAAPQPGYHLAFMVQADTSEYDLVTLPNVTLFRLNPRDVDRPADLQNATVRSARFDAMSVTEVHHAIESLKIPDQEQHFEAIGIFEWHFDRAPFSDSMCRFTANTRESPGLTRGVHQGGFLFEIAGYFPCDRLNPDAQLGPRFDHTSDRCTIRVEGAWVGGYFIASRIYHNACGVEILKPVERSALDETAARDIAQRAVAANDDWADRATYDVRRTDDGWSVLVLRIVGFDDNGAPQYTPGGHRLILIDDAGNILLYSRGE